MKHHAPLVKGGGVGGGNSGGRSAGDASEIIRGRTPIIFHCESGSDSSSSPHGYSDQQTQQNHQRQRETSRRPPPYRTVPLPWADGLTRSDGQSAPASSAAPSAPVRARSVPPQPAANSTGKPARPKSLHQDFVVSSHSVQPLKLQPSQRLAAAQPPYQSPQNPAPPPRCYPLRSSVSASAFPLSVSLQFDSLATDWSSSEVPVPSPAPTERRNFVRPSRALDSANKCNPAPIPRSSSVPRAQSPSRGGFSGRHPRPLSHPAGPVGSQWALSSQPANELRSHESLLSSRQPASGTSSLVPSRSHGHLDHHQYRHHHHNHQQNQDHHDSFGAPPRWPPNCINGFQLGATPAPAPSPSSTPSPSSRPLAHLPNDALRTNHGIRLLEKKLDLYVDIMQAQERFVQVVYPSTAVGDQFSVLFSYALLR